MQTASPTTRDREQDSPSPKLTNLVRDFDTVETDNPNSGGERSEPWLKPVFAALPVVVFLTLCHALAGIALVQLLARPFMGAVLLPHAVSFALLTVFGLFVVAALARKSPGRSSAISISAMADRLSANRVPALGIAVIFATLSFVGENLTPTSLLLAWNGFYVALAILTGYGVRSLSNDQD